MRAHELEESAVDELKNRLPKLKRHNYDTIDHLMQNISVKHKITGKKLHDLFVSKYGHTPDTWIKKIKNRLGEEGVAEGGYRHGFADPNSPSLGKRHREDDEYHVPDPVDTRTWYIRADGKIVKDKMGTPYQYRNKETATKAAQTMMTKSFNAGKKFVLTTEPKDEQGVAEAKKKKKKKSSRAMRR